jgi:4'-phosphopantetheinyl transferase
VPEPSNHKALCPVVWKVPAEVRRLAPRDRNASLSHLARQALAVSAGLGGFRPGRLVKDPSGRPLATNGCHWSLTHKPGYVGAVCAVAPVGIDIEQLRPVAPGLYRKLAGRREWELAGGERPDAFFRLWTAKEAAVKATGAGIADFQHCRLLRFLDRERLDLDYRGRSWQVAHFYFSGHVAAVVEAVGEVRWTLKGEGGVNGRFDGRQR